MKMSQMARGIMPSESWAPFTVCIFPEAVSPYAKMVPFTPCWADSMPLM